MAKKRETVPLAWMWSDGQEVDLQWHPSVVDDETGGLTGYLGFVLRVSLELEDSTEDLLKLQETVLEKLEAVLQLRGWQTAGAIEQYDVTDFQTGELLSMYRIPVSGFTEEQSLATGLTEEDRAWLDGLLGGIEDG